MGEHEEGSLLEAAGREAITLYGSTPPFCAFAAARVARKIDRPIVLVTPEEDQAVNLTRDAALFAAASTPADDAAQATPVLHLPAVDSNPYAELSPDRYALMGRMTALYRLAAGGPLKPRIVVCSAAALIRKALPPGELVQLTRTIAHGEEIDRDDTARFLVAAGYARAAVVEDKGTFAVRGGVIDVFPPIYGFPVRIELFGDEIETMRTFDPQSQRTLRDVRELLLHPARETVPTTGADPRARILAAADAASHPSKATRRILEAVDGGEEFVGIDTLTPVFHASMVPTWEYLRTLEPVWFALDPDGAVRSASDEIDEADARFRERLADHKLALEPAEHYASTDSLETLLTTSEHRILARRIELHDEAAERDTSSIRVNVDENRDIRGALERARTRRASELLRPLIDGLEQWSRDGWRIGIVCDSQTRIEKLAGLLSEYDVPSERRDDHPFDPHTLSPGGPVAIVSGALSSGFSLPRERIALLTEADVFGERRRVSARQKAAAKRARKALMGAVADFSQLSPGDYLVHQLHGVGLYKGLTKLPLAGTPIDFLHIEYNGGTLYLPVFRLGEVQRYVGAEGHKPRIDKLGGLTWEKQRKRVKREVRALAEELLQLYAQRAARPGHAFPKADAMFNEFEATFEFEETPDQLRAITEVMADMEKAQPMDRLVCGDVGYGKTEVALRAMLKAALGGKQVAMLAPTTVLVEQHYRTMQKRFAGWPVTIGRLSRFQTRKEQQATVLGLAEGKIDAVVGTHRLLSKDIRFKKLGLLIIDEEQRFGVAHKERLKKARTQIDVLTLTATPIPRTLHLAMTGLREISIIATPPADRRSVRTFVSRPEDGVLRRGVRQELARGGQVFFVVPRIGDRPSEGDRTLDQWAEHIRSLVPDARVAVAHGQMSNDALEKVMVGFVAGDFDVLVCTTIVESGLDISRANTMFVARADRFGLAQLYQLRGRIGRSKERAFCYLLVPPPKQLTEDARRRLEALQRFTDLGAGFLIASHDLEIRGAGELLGPKQSGSIAAVGFETYTTMLEDAVADLKGEAITREQDPELNVEVPGFIPDDYVPDTGQRLDLYKRLSSAEDSDEVSLILEEISDRYGQLPLEVTLLGELMVLKGYARRLRAQSVEVTSSRLALALGEKTPLAAEKIAELVASGDSAYRITPDMRLLRTFTESEKESPVAAARAALLELLSCVT